MAKEKHELIVEGNIQAKCSCGQWQFIGLMPEARKVLRDIFRSHLTVQHKRKK